MANDSRRTYRHSVTGLVARYHPRVASADKHLIEVADGAKPLAYTPITPKAVADYKAAHADEPEVVADAEGTDSDNEE